MRILPAVLAVLAVASPAFAQNSHCAGLPQTARVEARGPDNVIAAQLTPRGFTCPRGFTSETIGPVTRCRQPGPVTIENREPRRDCYASLPIGPVRVSGNVERPAMQCSSMPNAVNVVALRGRNLGWQDINVTAPTSAAVSIVHLRQTGGRTPREEDPALNDCFAHDCRLIRLTTRAGTPARFDLTVATPGNVATSAVTINNEAICR